MKKNFKNECKEIKLLKTTSNNLSNENAKRSKVNNDLSKENKNLEQKLETHNTDLEKPKKGLLLVKESIGKNEV